MAKDPVCKMDVDEGTTQWNSNYNGKSYYFCTQNCKAAFDTDPDKYLLETDIIGRKIK